MLKNYIKLAWRILSRKKFFTFIMLFGISITLAILMMITSFLQAELGSQAPMENQNNIVLNNRLALFKQFYDTIPVIDTTMLDGIAKYDTTYDYPENGRNMSSSSYKSKILNDYFRDIPSVSKSSLFSAGGSFDIFINNSKLSVEVNYTDEYFWEILNFKFLEGTSYGPEAIEQQEHVTVISDKFSKELFGTSTNVLGKMVEINAKQYKIIGVVNRPNSSLDELTVDMFVPYTTTEETGSDYYLGGYNMVHLAKGNTEQAKEDIAFAATKIPMDHTSDYNEIEVEPMTYKEYYAHNLYYHEDASRSLIIMKAILFGLISLFVLLPILNLINLNVSRILERSAEIGVRKAFGATKSEILMQFVFENIVQTLIGGLIGLLLAYIGIYLVNSSKILGTVQLTMNLPFFIWAFLIVLFFGILSGFIPAYKMSKLQIVNALKSIKL